MSGTDLGWWSISGADLLAMLHRVADGDDAAFGYATEAFCGPIRRLPGDMVHLWHPRLPESVPGSVGFVEQFTLVAEYRDAAAAGTVREYVEAR